MNQWDKKYDAQIIKQELGKTTIEWIDAKGIHRKVMTVAEFTQICNTELNLGSTTVDYLLRNGGV